ncbi:MAG: NmrA family NAD(P)-binding protein [Caulobacterales bacterium]|nr:NmrA family NAD(P)-binding protein [Caulobacterales bacterium]
MQHVLIVGATGRLGRHLVDRLLAQGDVVSALVRQDPRGDPSRRSLLDRFRTRGVKLMAGALEDEASLEVACRGVDAVVSCVDHRPDHLRLQANLAKAAAQAGSVRRILPSQFGIDSRLYGQARVDHGDLKRELQQVFIDSGVPTTFVHINGLASAWVGCLGQLGLSAPPAHEVEVYGDGTVRFSTVAPEDVARYATRALADFRTRNRHVTIAPPQNRLTQLELIALWEAKSGARLRRRFVSPQALDARIEALAQDPAQRPQLAMAQLVRAAWIDGLGDGRRLPDAIELSELYPEIDYRRPVEYLERYLPAQTA